MRRKKKLGEILVELGHIDEATVLRHIEFQALQHPRQLLGELMLTTQAITWEQLKEALARQAVVA